MKGNQLVAILLVAVLLATVAAQKDKAKQGESWWMEKIKSWMTWSARTYIDNTFGSIVESLTFNPRFYCIPGDPTCSVTAGMDVLMNRWIKMLVPFYMIAMMFTALFFLLKAGTPRGRARARSMFLKLVFGMAVVAMSPLLYQIMLESSAMLVNWFLTETGTNINLGLFTVPINFRIFGVVNVEKLNNVSWQLNHSGMAMSCIFLYVACGMLVASNIILWIRNMAVFFYGVFFPAILFLYFFDVTKPLGQKWLNASMKWAYAPALQALLLAFTIEIANNISLWNFSGPDIFILTAISNAMAGMMIIAGLVAFILAPMIVGQLMSWLGDAVAAVGLGTGRAWMVAAGGIMAGQGGGAIIQADTEYARGSSYERYMSLMTDSGNFGPMNTGGGQMGATGSIGQSAGSMQAGGGGQSGSSSASRGGGGGYGSSQPSGGSDYSGGAWAFTPEKRQSQADGGPKASAGPQEAAQDDRYGKITRGESEGSSGKSTGFSPEDLRGEFKTGPNASASMKKGSFPGVDDTDKSFDEQMMDAFAVGNRTVSTDSDTATHVSTSGERVRAFKTPQAGENMLPQGNEHEVGVSGGNEKPPAPKPPKPAEAKGQPAPSPAEGDGSRAFARLVEADNAQFAKSVEDKNRAHGRNISRSNTLEAREAEILAKRLADNKEEQRGDSGWKEQEADSDEARDEAERASKAKSERERRKNIDNER